MTAKKKPKRSGQALTISIILHLVLGLYIYYKEQNKQVFKAEDSISISFVVPPKIEIGTLSTTFLITIKSDQHPKQKQHPQMSASMAIRYSLTV